jgi:hypothetical protein
VTKYDTIYLSTNNLCSVDESKRNNGKRYPLCGVSVRLGVRCVSVGWLAAGGLGLACWVGEGRSTWNYLTIINHHAHARDVFESTYLGKYLFI